MTAYMLDTNAVSDFVRNPGGVVAGRVNAGAPVSISIVVAAELRFGAARRNSARLTTAIEEVFELMEIAPLAPPVDRVYGALRADLERTGRTLDANDLLIAAHALTLDRVLVSDDRAFERVRGLKVENWLRPD